MAEYSFMGPVWFFKNQLEYIWFPYELYERVFLHNNESVD